MILLLASFLHVWERLPQRTHSHYNLALHNNNKRFNCLLNQIMLQTKAPEKQIFIHKKFVLSLEKIVQFTDFFCSSVECDGKLKAIFVLDCCKIPNSIL